MQSWFKNHDIFDVIDIVIVEVQPSPDYRYFPDCRCLRNAPRAKWEYVSGLKHPDIGAHSSRDLLGCSRWSQLIDSSIWAPRLSTESPAPVRAVMVWFCLLLSPAAIVSSNKPNLTGYSLPLTTFTLSSESHSMLSAARFDWPPHGGGECIVLLSY